MTTQEVADRLIALCKKGENLQAIKELYHQDVISLEDENMPDPKTKGLDNIIDKNKKWFETVEEYHGGDVSEPMIADNHFSCKFTMDCTFKEQGRMQIEELGVYEVKDGKIVKEQFFYSMP